MAENKELQRFLEEERTQPIKRFIGRNRIRLCGRSTRCFCGGQPTGLIKTFLMINIPATAFNVAVAPVELWDDSRNIILGIGVLL